MITDDDDDDDDDDGDDDDDDNDGDRGGRSNGVDMSWGCVLTYYVYWRL